MAKAADINAASNTATKSTALSDFISSNIYNYGRTESEWVKIIIASPLEKELHILQDECGDTIFHHAVAAGNEQLTKALMHHYGATTIDNYNGLFFWSMVECGYAGKQDGANFPATLDTILIHTADSEHNEDILYSLQSIYSSYSQEKDNDAMNHMKSLFGDEVVKPLDDNINLAIYDSDASLDAAGDSVALAGEDDSAEG